MHASTSQTYVSSVWVHRSHSCLPPGARRVSNIDGEVSGKAKIAMCRQWKTKKERRCRFSDAVSEVGGARKRARSHEVKRRPATVAKSSLASTDHQNSMLQGPCIVHEPLQDLQQMASSECVETRALVKLRVLVTAETCESRAMSTAGYPDDPACERTPRSRSEPAAEGQVKCCQLQAGVHLEAANLVKPS